MGSAYGLCALLIGVCSCARAADHFALMINSLKTFQVHACDGDPMQIKCPNGTVISLNFVRYGRPSGLDNGQCLEPSRLGPERDLTTECSSETAFRIVEKNCQEHSRCRFIVSSKTFQDDPCPDVRKYAEVAYKCRPYEFENRITCENGQMVLKCPNPLKLMIYSAFFGSTKNGTVDCPRTSGPNNEACQSSYTTEEVIGRCFGKEQCELQATSELFGEPMDCMTSTEKFLKVVFTCVLPAILVPYKDKMTRNLTYSNGHIYTKWLPESELPSQTGLYDSQSTVSGRDMQQDSTIKPVQSSADDREVVQFFAAWLSASKFMRDNKQKLALYVSLSLSVGLMFFIVVVWLNFILRSNFLSRVEKPTEPPVTDDDFFSDSDLEHYEGEFSSSANSTMMRKFSEAVPRAPVSDGPQTNHFFS